MRTCAKAKLQAQRPAGTTMPRGGTQRTTDNGQRPRAILNYMIYVAGTISRGGEMRYYDENTENLGTMVGTMKYRLLREGQLTKY
jgi:hypothetical protein